MLMRPRTRGRRAARPGASATRGRRRGVMPARMCGNPANSADCQPRRPRTSSAPLLGWWRDGATPGQITGSWATTLWRVGVKLAMAGRSGSVLQVRPRRRLYRRGAGRDHRPVRAERHRPKPPAPRPSVQPPTHLVQLRTVEARAPARRVEPPSEAARGRSPPGRLVAGRAVTNDDAVRLRPDEPPSIRRHGLPVRPHGGRPSPRDPPGPPTGW